MRHIHQLKGKRIAAEGGTLAAYFLSRILSKAQLSAVDIQVVNLPLHMHAEALQNGRVDASINHAPVHTQLGKIGLVPLFSSRDLPGEIIDVLAINPQHSSPELHKRMRALWFSSLETWLEHRSKTDPLAHKRLGLDAQSLPSTLNGIIMGDKALNKLYFEQGLLASRIKQMQLYMLDSGLQKKSINTNQLLPSCIGSAC